MKYLLMPLLRIIYACLLLLSMAICYTGVIIIGFWDLKWAKRIRDVSGMRVSDDYKNIQDLIMDRKTKPSMD